MARARNIKPSFFVSEQISENSPLGRLLFIGMWTLADHKGDLEWKPKTIKIQILPWDECSVEALAITLDKSGLIRFYSDGDRVYIHIPTFVKHQNPHKNEKEKGSEIPAYSDVFRQVIDLQTLTINRDKSRAEPESSQSDPADSPIPPIESPILNPDSGMPESPAEPEAPAAKKSVALDYSCWPEMPTDQTMSDWKALRKRQRADVSQTVINQFGKQLRIAGTHGYSVEDCLTACVTNGWRGFEYEWLKNRTGPRPPQRSPPPRAASVNYTQAQYASGINPDGSF